MNKTLKIQMINDLLHKCDDDTLESIRCVIEKMVTGAHAQESGSRILAFLTRLL